MGIGSYLFGCSAGIVSLLAVQYFAQESLTVKNTVIYNLKPTPIEEGYVNPNNLELRLEDFNNNGEKETIVRLDNTDYLFKIVEGNPILQKYEVKPVEVLPKNN